VNGSRWRCDDLGLRLFVVLLVMGMLLFHMVVLFRLFLVVMLLLGLLMMMMHFLMLVMRLLFMVLGFMVLNDDRLRNRRCWLVMLKCFVDELSRTVLVDVLLFFNVDQKLHIRCVIF
jgi:hypothetical protein